MSKKDEQIFLTNNKINGSIKLMYQKKEGVQNESS